ncbi:hypothetical protein ACGFXC_36735 [Streptomyces sp. NPDC048507]|uniref:hypothetical protein n=1 Tax=Streptomyces sp. NPDC048507 TaxID=3365560 RepID=UPI003722C3CD
MIIPDLGGLRSWATPLATGTLLATATRKARLETQPIGKPGASYGLGIFDVQGWIGHDGSIPGYESQVAYLPEARATTVILLNTDSLTAGRKPSAFFGQGVAGIIPPAHEYPGHDSLLHQR